MGIYSISKNLLNPYRKTSWIHTEYRINQNQLVIQLIEKLIDYSNWFFVIQINDLKKILNLFFAELELEASEVVGVLLLNVDTAVRGECEQRRCGFLEAEARGCCCELGGRCTKNQKNFLFFSPDAIIRGRLR